MNVSTKGSLTLLNALWKFLQNLIWVLVLRWTILYLRFSFFFFGGFIWSLILFSFDYCQVFSSYCHQSVCLPQQLRDPLLHEMENYILGAVLNKNTKQKPLSEVFIMCALLSNIMYGLFLTRFVYHSFLINKYHFSFFLIRKKFLSFIMNFPLI